MMVWSILLMASYCNFNFIISVCQNLSPREGDGFYSCCQGSPDWLSTGFKSFASNMCHMEPELLCVKLKHEFPLYPQPDYLNFFAGRAISCGDSLRSPFLRRVRLESAHWSQDGGYCSRVPSSGQEESYFSKAFSSAQVPNHSRILFSCWSWVKCCRALYQETYLTSDITLPPSSTLYLAPLPCFAGYVTLPSVYVIDVISHLQ